MKKLLIIDRDGTLTVEPNDFQLDTFNKLVFYPGVFQYLGNISRDLDYELIMVTNQDGLGTENFPESDFWPTKFLIKTFKNEGIIFKEVFIDRTFPEDNAPTRKPGTALLESYINNTNYDLKNSFVIGDRLTDMQLAKNLGCKGVFIDNNPALGAEEVSDKDLDSTIVLKTKSWEFIYRHLLMRDRAVSFERKTSETVVYIEINLDGRGESKVETGLAFFDHMLDQFSKHGGIDLSLKTVGDLDVDEHHTIEDTAIALGEAISCSWRQKRNRTLWFYFTYG